jgi:hypothetical protein
MKNRHQINQKLFLIILFLNLMIYGKSIAQITGSLFMLPDNFYAQIYNPSYMRTDNATEISIAGFGGFSFINQGSFKISDLITTTSEGNPVVDFDNFYKNINTNNYIRQDFSLPMAFLSLPLQKGVFSFYYKENISSVLKFKKDIFEFLVNGNYPPDYRNFNSDAIKGLIVGYREFAFGFSQHLNKKLDVGIRAKLLFGAVLVNADNWNYGIETTTGGFSVSLLSGGGGQLMLPVPMVLREDNTLLSINSDNAVMKYLTAYQNPGLAFDFGVTYFKNEKNTFSAGLRDLGGIWYRHKAKNMILGDKYSFMGFDLVSAVRYPEETEYRDPLEIILEVKDSIRNVYEPVLEETSFMSGLAPKTVIHYQHIYSDKLSFGITNQSAFQKDNFQNILTLSAMQNWTNLSVFENLNLHGASDISLGGGIQYEGNFIQAFLATDNLIAFYHPANNKTFSITAGLCLLLNHKKDTKNTKAKNMKGKNGKISPELPFYKQIK